MINALFAVDHYGGMGFQGTLPWPHNAEDLAHFQKLTTGHVVVMGSRSWADPKMPKPLDGRTVYIASNKPVQYAGRISGDIKEEILTLEKQHPTQIIWVVGGSMLLEECSGIFDQLHLTHFKGSYKIDTKINLKNFLAGFIPVRASVSDDRKSTFIKYEPIFKRITTSP
jgi:dihydrofolate reductase